MKKRSPESVAAEIVDWLSFSGGRLALDEIAISVEVGETGSLLQGAKKLLLDSGRVVETHGGLVLELVR